VLFNASGMIGCRKIPIAILVILIMGAGWWWRDASVKPVGHLSRKDVLAIRQAMYRAEFAQMQLQSKSPWVHLRYLPTTINLRFHTRILEKRRNLTDL